MEVLPPRIPTEQLFSQLDHRGRDLSPGAFEGKSRYILTDVRDIPDEVVARLGPVIHNLDSLGEDHIIRSVFYVYFQRDEDALPFLRRLTELGSTFVPHLFFGKTEYRFVSSIAAEALQRTWKLADRISHLAPGIHENICEALEIASSVEGDYVEIGVYKGGSALTALNCLDILAERQLAPPRKAWLFDTFEGFNYEEAASSSDAIWYNTHSLLGADATLAYVRETLRYTKTSFELKQLNICEEALPDEIRRIAVANIDVDMYEPTLDALRKVAPLIADGGIIIAEDPASTPGLYGAYLAMDEFLQTSEGQNFRRLFKGHQYFLLKRSKMETRRLRVAKTIASIPILGGFLRNAYRRATGRAPSSTFDSKKI